MLKLNQSKMYSSNSTDYSDFVNTHITLMILIHYLQMATAVYIKAKYRQKISKKYGFRLRPGGNPPFLPKSDLLYGFFRVPTMPVNIAEQK